MRECVIIKLALHARVERTRFGCVSGDGSARRQLMPARETEAIILKTFSLGEADRLVSFFGRHSGRMRGVAAGARRIKNRYGSSLELLSHVQVWYTERETRDLVRIQQCELLESFHKSQSDYSLSTGLALVSEISEQVLPEHEAADAMFRLVLLTVREIERRGDWRLPATYFAFWTVRLGGYLPQLSRCANCGSDLREEPGYHAPWQEGLSCGKCRQRAMRPLHVEGRRIAEMFATEKLDKIELLPGMETALEELRDAALNWIEHHTEKSLVTRKLLESA